MRNLHCEREKMRFETQKKEKMQFISELETHKFKRNIDIPFC
jgi:hypothetical protein